MQNMVGQCTNICKMARLALMMQIYLIEYGFGAPIAHGPLPLKINEVLLRDSLRKALI